MIYLDVKHFVVCGLGTKLNDNDAPRTNMQRCRLRQLQHTAVNHKVLKSSENKRVALLGFNKHTKISCGILMQDTRN